LYYNFLFPDHLYFNLKGTDKENSIDTSLPFFVAGIQQQWQIKYLALPLPNSLLWLNE